MPDFDNASVTPASGEYRAPVFNSFIGRTKEFAELQQLLLQPDCRLLTLVGPGGIGKTRLALQLGDTVSDAFARGTTVIYLQPLRSAEFFVPAVADGLGFSLSGQEAPLVQLGQYLGDKEALIILDNFEHLLDAGEMLSRLLPYTPHVKYLVTSREALNLQQEWLYPIRGLTFPGQRESEAGQGSYDAVRLFAERAQHVYADFSLDAESEAIFQICRLVGGMPLALELAAAWRKTLNCHEIAEEIQTGLNFLTARLRDVSERHSSIQTVFDQTWRRLNAREQDVFRRLSVFRGGFQRGAVGEVTGASLALLSSLVDKSLLRLDASGRYQVHELLRQYGAEQLEKTPDDAQQAQADHARYYIDFLHQRRENICGGRQREALLEIKRELDNIRIAWLWAVAQADAEALQRGSESLGLYYQFLGGYLEGMTLFSRATEALEAQPPSEAVDRALLGTLMYQAWYHLRFGRQHGTEACMAQSLAIYRRLDIPPLAGYLTDPNAPLSFVALARGDYAAAAQYAELVRQIGESQQHPTNRQFAYHLLAEAHLGLGEYETAREFAQQAYAQALITGDRWFMAYILNNMGQIAVALGDIRMGKTHFQSSYTIREAFEDPEGMALALINLGNLAFKDQDLGEAEERYRRSLEIYQEINDRGGLAAANWGLGRVFCELGDRARTQSHYGQALQLALEIDYRPVLSGLLVDIAELLWKMDQRERPLSLLAFTALDPATDHETQTRANTRLTEYKNAVSAHVYADAVTTGEASELDILATDLLYQLSLSVSEVTEELAGPTLPGPAQALIEPLTPRELEVLRLLCDGLTNREIADKLTLAVGTVKYYTGQIYGKFGVRNRVNAVACARELHLIDIP